MRKRFETFQRYKRSTIKPSLANEGESWKMVERVIQSTNVSLMTDLTSRISLLFNLPSIFIILTLSMVLI